MKLLFFYWFMFAHASIDVNDDLSLEREMRVMIEREYNRVLVVF